ncbi:unnamed protein product [Coregonus sp. 'balchen']|nr:unnamed protein product [Coregonus sp. 'balchen']
MFSCLTLFPVDPFVCTTQAIADIVIHVLLSYPLSMDPFVCTTQAIADIVIHVLLSYPLSMDPFVCTTQAIADIVILVDGSWSIGRINFRLVRMFLENLVNAFSVGMDQTRIDAVLDAVKNLPYKGGNTLTDGKSQDDVIPPAQSLRDAGVELFAVGVKNADENELRAIASEPDHTHVYNVADFSIMSSIIEGLTKIVCERVEEQDKEIKGESAEQETRGAPQDLVISEVTARSFRVSWSHAPGSVEKYRVVYYPATQGGRPEESVVDGTENSVVVQNLNSLTEYQLAVFAVYTSSASEALRGSETTLALPMVNGLELYDVTHNTMRARWSGVQGVSGYTVLYAPLTEDGASDEKEVSDAVTDLELGALTPATEYTVTVYAMYGEEASDPMTNQETTLPLSPPKNLVFSEVDHNSAKLSWEAASRKVTGYRIMYVKTGGRQTNEVEVGPVTSWTLNDLTSVMEYEVAIFGIYNEGQSEAISGMFTTDPVPGPVDLQASEVTTESFRVSWGHSVPGIVLYKLTWASYDGEDTKEVIARGACAEERRGSWGGGGAAGRGVRAVGGPGGGRGGGAGEVAGGVGVRGGVSFSFVSSRPSGCASSPEARARACAPSARREDARRH